MSREDKLTFLRAVEERERRRREAPLLYYQPHAGQRHAHSVIDPQKARIIIIHPGNRWGKSHMNGAEIVAWLYGYRPWLVPGLRLTPEGDYPPRSQIPVEYWLRRADGVPLLLPARHLCVSGLGARQGILGTMWPKIESFLPPAVLRHPDFSMSRGAFSVPQRVSLPRDLSTGGAVIDFGSGKQDPMEYEGQSWTSCSVDEPFKQVFWGPIWRGMIDHLGPVWFTCTPVGENAPWIYREFIQGEMNVITVQGHMNENPYVTDQARKDFLDMGGFSDEERDARTKGSWCFLSHLAFPTFDPSVHIIPDETPVDPLWVRGLAVDPAHRRPFMAVWGSVNAHEEWIIDDEWPFGIDHSKINSSELTVPEYVKLFRNREQGANIDFRCLDPRFGRAAHRLKGEVHTSIQEDFEQAGMLFDCRIDGCEREETGIEKIRQLLYWDKSQPLSPTNRPRLRVKRRCINVINALMHSTFVPPGARTPDSLPEKLAEKFKDSRDCLRYLTLYPYIPPFGTKDASSGYISEEDLIKENNEDL